MITKLVTILFLLAAGYYAFTGKIDFATYYVALATFMRVSDLGDRRD